MQHPLMKLIKGKKVKLTEKKKFCIIQNRGLLYSFRCLRGPSEEYLKEKQIILDNSLGKTFWFDKLLFKEKKNKTLILDLDETLIHSCETGEYPDVTCKVKIKDNGDIINHSVIARF